MGVGLPLGLLRSTPSEDHLAWHRTEIGRRPAEFGVGGDDGPPVVFLHGWGLGSRAYKRAIKRLIARGCRVYAPALPSFGRTADLPAGHMTLDGYAEWVAEFMTVVGIEEPALIIGHSFGGGVGIKLAQQRPDLVSYLVLLNAVGGVNSRPAWSWAAGFAAELWPLPQALDTVEAVTADLVPNILHNPIGLLRAAGLARSADLRAEAAELCSRGLPVLVLTSERDGVIPRNAFETLCSSIGSEGRVVSGRHSWLLADPDSFGAALASLVDVRVADHRTSRAVTRADAVAELLGQTRMPKRTVKSLVHGAPPLWLMSEPAEVLAGDLALCHPKLGPGELRAVARPIAGSSTVRLTVVATDRRGLLADSAQVLAAHGLSISHASAATWPDQGMALHSLVVQGGYRLDEQAWNRIGDALRAMADKGPVGPITLRRATPPLRVEVHGEGGDRIMLTITARDRLGVLSGLCRTLADLGANIESLQARSRHGIATDTFLLASAPGLLDLEHAFGMRLLG